MRWRILSILALIALLGGRAALAQSLDEQLDEDRFLKGLAELGLHDLLDYTLESGGKNDAAMARLVEIAHLQATLGGADLSIEERSQAIDRLIAARRQLLDEHPNDPRLPLWQADLAFNLLFLQTAPSALDLTVEYGIADQSQRDQMAATAGEALRLVDEAIVGLSDEILDLEEDEDFASNAAMQQRHRYLLQVEQRQRMPFLNAAAVYYSTIARPGDSAADQWRQVADTLIPLLGELTEPWLSRARSMVGVSEVHLGRYDDARVQFNTLLASPGADAVSVLRARFGGVELRRQSEGQAAGASALDKLAAGADIRRDPFTFLLLCDQRFLDAVRGSVAMEGGGPAFHATTGDAAQLLVKEAVRAYRAYLDNDLLPINAAQREEVVAARWRLILPDSIPLTDLPPEMALAQAERMTTDPQRQTDAVTLLQSLLEKHGKDEAIAPRLLLALANVHAARNEAAQAAKMWMDVATRFPLSPRAQQAAELAAAILSAAALEHPDAPELAALYEQALTLVVERYPQASAFDRWAYERGLLMARRARYTEAAHSFDLIGAESELYLDAAFQVVQAKWNEAQAERVDEVRASMLADVAATADRMLRLIDKALASGSAGADRLRDLRYYRVAVAVRAAQADRDRGAYEASLKRLEGLELGEGIDDPLAAEIIDARISVLEALQRTDQIGKDLQELAQRSPDRALSIITRIASQRLAEAQRLVEAGDEDGAAEMSKDRIQPVSRLGWSIAQPLSKSKDAGLAAGLCQADALRLARDYPAALAIYEQVLVWRENSAEAILGRSECLYALDRLAEALSGYQRLAAASAERHDTEFWLAELRILQIFDRADRNTDRIFPRIQRLRLVDGQLGGARFRKAFAVLEDRHAP